MDVHLLHLIKAVDASKLVSTESTLTPSLRHEGGANREPDRRGKGCSRTSNRSW